MKGVINKGIQELVESRFGSEAWESVKEKAGCEEPFFAVSEDYPDEMTEKLAKAASEVSGLSLEQVMVEFGKFWVPNTGKANYGTYFAIAGSNPREFLLNMNEVHRHVTKSISNATPPHFECEELPDGRLLMVYESERGLCAVMRGLIMGVGILFDQTLEVQEIKCKHKGDQQCVMEVTFP